MMREAYKIWYRTFRYKHKNDIGGMNYIKSHVKQGDTAFDIGAHKGAYLNLFRKCVGMQGTVVGFEPQGLLYAYLTSIKKTLNWSNVSIEHLALSDQEGRTNLYIPDNSVKEGSSPGASLLKSGQETMNTRIEEVATRTLDNYIIESELSPGFLKIDVEGNELNIFKGGKTLLSKAKPKILVEIEARHVGEEKVMETFQFLKDLHYSGRFIHKKALVHTDKFTFERYQNRGNMDDYCNNFVFE